MVNDYICNSWNFMSCWYVILGIGTSNFWDFVVLVLKVVRNLVLRLVFSLFYPCTWGGWYSLVLYEMVPSYSWFPRFLGLVLWVFILWYFFFVICQVPEMSGIIFPHVCCSDWYSLVLPSTLSGIRSRYLVFSSLTPGVVAGTRSDLLVNFFSTRLV